MSSGWVSVPEGSALPENGRARQRDLRPTQTLRASELILSEGPHPTGWESRPSDRTGRST